jgi:hypothetical protein
MEEIPKIVVERLKAGAVTAGHPEADVLTAFSERLLPERERGMVMEHLARCGECRNVVALALPETETVQAVAEPAPRSWLAWPALRWGFVALGIALVGSFGAIELEKTHQPTMVASREAAPMVAEKVQQAPPTAAPAAPGGEEPKAADTKSAPTAPIAESEKRKAVPPAPPVREESATTVQGKNRDIARFSGNAAGGPRVANQMQLNSNFQQQNSAVAVNTPPAPAPRIALADQQAGAQASQVQVPAATQMVTVEAAAPAVTAQGRSTQALVVQNQPLDKQTLDGGQSETTSDATRPSVVGFSTAAKVAGRPSRSGATVGGSLQGQGTRWTISSYGGLQRSTDQGNSWQDVNVSDASPAASGMTLASATPAKELKKDAESDKVERSKSPTPVFRAVWANGSEVWAGGSGGMLYHSTDAGGHWTRVVPSTSGTTLTGEILSVAFSDAQHGRVTTSTSEVWTTQDDGQSWQRQ